jgi:hypothetical protein
MYHRKLLLIVEATEIIELVHRSMGLAQGLSPKAYRDKIDKYQWVMRE